MKVLPEAKSQAAVYCQGAGAVVEVEGSQCNGWTHVSGDGVLRAKDKYGVPYRRPCPRAASWTGAVIWSVAVSSA